LRICHFSFVFTFLREKMSLVLCIISIGEWLNGVFVQKSPLEMIASISGDKSQRTYNG
jgi:hypothetical protein